MNKPALLALEDGSLFYGESVGYQNDALGEVVFNTAMTGYQEIMTDPSYARQLITLTYPHIGNVGFNEEDAESDRIHATGLIIRDASIASSNWRSQISLLDYLQQHRITGIADIDTRRLTVLLRDKGSLRGCITTQVDDPLVAVRKAQHCPSLEGLDLAQQVTCEVPYEWTAGTWDAKQGFYTAKPANKTYHVVVYDFGVKHNILRLLIDRGCKITVIPAKTTAKAVMALKPDGVLLSNGPGDPAACDYAIAAIQQLLEKNIPLFGICLGFQLLALACGATTFKMKLGHHGANHPVQDLLLSTVMITSQNHGFAVDEKTLPSHLEVTHRSLFDDTLQGICHRHNLAFGFQGHPEASPGPHDIQCLFDKFIDMLADVSSE